MAARVRSNRQEQGRPPAIPAPRHIGGRWRSSDRRSRLSNGASSGMGLGAMVDMLVTPDHCVSSLVVSRQKRPRPV